jgi:3-hydroxy-9,10-secoandrosta-1,3,5(10)-triene-9,17-dione monooxygenase reductase component
MPTVRNIALQDPRMFREALGAFATGVTIVTTRGADSEDIGITANSFNSVSLDPPMVLWSLARKAMSLPAFLAHSHFAVHILAANQEELSQRFATSGVRKFADLQVTRGEGDVPLLDGCSARFQCRKAFAHDGGDHVIFVGEVVAFSAFKTPPLLYHAGRYAIAVEKSMSTGNCGAGTAELESSFSRDFLVYLLGRARFQMYQKLRDDLERHSLDEDEWYVLSLLSMSDRRTIAELDALLWHTGSHVTYERVARLASLGFVHLGGGHDPGAVVTLTDQGREAVLHLVAAAKAIESHAERNLGPGEAQMMKNALRKIIRDTDPGTPPLFSRSDED